MNTQELLFYFVCILALLSAGAILLVKDVFNAALLLIVCLVCVAGIFIFLQADFLAVAQILLYAGGVLLLILFGIMMSARTSAFRQDSGRQNIFGGSLAGLLMAAIMWIALYRTPFDNDSQAGPFSISQMGVSLVSSFVAPFELAGILLLVSMIGAMAAASFNRKS